jgi:hypothetical protein
MLSVWNINLLIATISQILAQYELTRKWLHKVAEEQDEELRSIWEADIKILIPDVFMWLSRVTNFGRSAEVQWKIFLACSQRAVKPDSKPDADRKWENAMSYLSR